MGDLSALTVVANAIVTRRRRICVVDRWRQRRRWHDEGGDGNDLLLFGIAATLCVYARNTLVHDEWHMKNKSLEHFTLMSRL